MTGFSTAEIDGWVFEWTCIVCGAQLTIGITAEVHADKHAQPTPNVDVTYCPYCSRQHAGSQIKKRTIYHNDLASVQGAARHGTKVLASEGLRALRVAKGYNRSSPKECSEDVEEMISEYKQYTQGEAA